MENKEERQWREVHGVNMQIAELQEVKYIARRKTDGAKDVEERAKGKL